MIGSELFGEVLFGGSISDADAIDMEGAVGDTVVFGPDYLTDEDGSIISTPGEYPVPLSIEVVTTEDLDTIITTLDDSFARSFNDESNETGAGTLSLANGDPDNALVPLDSMITYSVYGRRAYSMLVESKHRITLDEGEEAEQITAFNGRGHVSIFERAVLYPSRGVGIQPIEEDRTFNWSTPSPVYNDAAWGKAKQICTVATAQSIWPHQPFADGWHDLTAGVIWSPGSTAMLAPGGNVYFRKDVNVPADGFYLLEAACDNEGELYLDGQKVIDLGGFTGTFSYSVFITQGQHTIAVVGQNYHSGPPRVQGGPGQGPAGLIMALYSTDSNGEPVSVIFHTDSTWKIVAYPETPPGMYVGEVLHYVYNEAIARGVKDFNNIELKFGKRLDSAGEYWPETLDIASKVGTHYLTFLVELASTYIDWWMKPGTLEFYAWNKGTRNRISGVSLHAPTDEDDPTTGNLFEQTHTVFG